MFDIRSFLFNFSSSIPTNFSYCRYCRSNFGTLCLAPRIMVLRPCTQPVRPCGISTALTGCLTTLQHGCMLTFWFPPFNINFNNSSSLMKTYGIISNSYHSQTKWHPIRKHVLLSARTPFRSTITVPSGPMLSWKCRKMQRESLQLLSVAYLAIKVSE